MTLSTVEEGEMFPSLKDWRKAIRTPPTYRVVKNTSKFQTQAVLGFTLACLFLLYLFYGSDSEENATDYKSQAEEYITTVVKYNSTYPITKPVHVHDSIHYKIGLIADMDHSSRSKLESNTWISYYLQGTLIWNPSAQTVDVKLDKNHFKTLKTKYSYNGRGMELSELVTFNGDLIVIEDRSGIVYRITDENANAWLLLTDGDGRSDKGNIFVVYKLK